MKTLKSILLEVYWIGLFAILTYISIKFIGWYHTFNTIIFYLMAFWFLYYDYKTFFSNIALFKLTHELFLKNRPLRLGLIWLIIRTIFIVVGVFYFLSNTYAEQVVFYEGYKLFGLISFLGFVFVNYIRISIINIENLIS
jgi:hypothetical protein